MIAANLLRALIATGYRVELNGGRLIVAPAAGPLPIPLRSRIAEHRDALKALLTSDDPFAGCTPCDDTLRYIDAHRFSPDRLAELIICWLERYAETGYAPFVEVAAWFAAVLEMRRRIDRPTDEAERSVWLCAGCSEARSLDDGPCPKCGATAGRCFYPDKEAA